MIRLSTDNSHRTLSSLDDIKTLRVTQLQSLLECPAGWRARMLGHGNTESGPAAKIGTAAHLTIEHYLSLQWEYPEGWLEQSALLVRAGASESDRRAILTYCLAQQERRDRVIALEKSFTLPLVEGLPPISGHIDLLLCDEDGELRIVDHKTNRSYETADVWRDKVQMKFYAWAVRQLYPFYDEVRFEIGYVLLGEQVQWTTDPSDDLALACLYQEAWEEQLDAREGERWPQRRHPGCAWCPIKEECHTYTDYRHGLAGKL